ncbi:MAG: porin [Betaproteobacteria bacterium]|nr:porin [Betaproteobacteria bacterium]
MQKKLLTAAVAGVLAAPISAMAAVTVYGTIDTGIRMQTDAITTTGDESVLLITDGTRTTNRWGLRGSEDLGGGLKANFNLEGQYGSDTGALGSSPATGSGPTLVGTTGSANVNQGLFQRKAIVGLSGGNWSVDLGRDYTVNFKTQGVYDPMSYTYTGITPTAGNNVAGTRHSNLITAGFRFGTGGIRLDYSMGEQAGDNSNQSAYGINGDFVFGNFTVVAAFTTRSATTVALGDVDQDTLNIGGVYKMGAWTFRLGYSTSEYSATGLDVDTPMIVAGVQYGFSPTLNGRFGYYTMDFNDNTNTVQGGSRDWIIFALDYILSKSTTLYAAIDINNMDGNSITVNGNTGAITVGTGGTGSVLGINSRDGATGFTVGIAHAF